MQFTQLCLSASASLASAASPFDFLFQTWSFTLFGKDILAHGGASFAQSLAQLNLIDEYRLVVHPAVLGRGLSLFGGLTAPLDLKLESATVFASGVVAKVYRPA